MRSYDVFIFILMWVLGINYERCLCRFMRKVCGRYFGVF